MTGSVAVEELLGGNCGVRPSQRCNLPRSHPQGMRSSLRWGPNWARAYLPRAIISAGSSAAMLAST